MIRILAIGLLTNLVIACQSTPSPSPTSVSDTSPVTLKIVGIAQDAGYPQADCHKTCCQQATRQRVSCVGIIDRQNEAFWMLDASPDFTSQLADLQQTAGAEAQFAGVLLTHAHIGHYTGLMYLGREAMGARQVPVWAMPRMENFLKTNGPWSQLITLKNIEISQLANNQNQPLSSVVRITPWEVPHRDEFSETVGFFIQGPNKTALYLPDIDKWNRWERDIVDLIDRLDYLIIDGTFFANGEIPNRDMSEIPHPFVEESMALFHQLKPEQKKRIHFIHFNHTNPLIQRDSKEYQQVLQNGYQVAYDGLELTL
ncbi:MAG: MBL fold metallo-hydrolase [Salibacteraceae bacterium]